MSEEKSVNTTLRRCTVPSGVVLDQPWQTKDQLTITVKVNYLPEVVEFLYYQQGGWLSVLFGNDERKLNGHYAVYYVLSMIGTKCRITVRVEVNANKPNTRR